MTVEIRTTGVKPIRSTFAHLAARFGDKPAQRYQEIAYDTQPTTNFHYKPLWDPRHELYDARRTAVVMRDWYALKDPRQFYYGNYTTTRAKQQEALDLQLAFIEKRDLLRALAPPALQQLVHIIVPLRHYEFGANMNNAHMAAYGYGTAIVQACMMNCVDRLGMAQHLSRIGLLTDGNSGEALALAKQRWLEAPEWQAVRRTVEKQFVTRDWMELFVAQNLVADALVYALFFRHFDAVFAAGNGPALSSLTDYLVRWFEDTARWVDATVKTVVAESRDNHDLVLGWTRQWRARWAEALAPLATCALGESANEVLTAVLAELDKRAAKLGLDL